MATWSPGRSSTSPSSNRSLAAPFSTTNHSASSWSYQNPAGEACPYETIRSTLT
jgi:hypothetical protein